jgi:hypothetical protein
MTRQHGYNNTTLNNNKSMCNNTKPSVIVLCVPHVLSGFTVVKLALYHQHWIINKAVHCGVNQIHKVMCPSVSLGSTRMCKLSLPQVIFLLPKTPDMPYFNSVIQFDCHFPYICIIPYKQPINTFSFDIWFV